MSGLVGRFGAWLIGIALDNDAQERARYRAEGYASAIQDALEVVATAETRREITEELCSLRAEVLNDEPTRSGLD